MTSFTVARPDTLTLTHVMPDDLVEILQRKWLEVRDEPTWADVLATWPTWLDVLRHADPALDAVYPDPL